jgi:hypothetical protein
MNQSLVKSARKSVRGGVKAADTSSPEKQQDSKESNLKIIVDKE